MHKITFSYRGFVVAVLYNEIFDSEEAIESAAFHVVNKWDSVKIEKA